MPNNALVRLAPRPRPAYSEQMSTMDPAKMDSLDPSDWNHQLANSVMLGMTRSGVSGWGPAASPIQLASLQVSELGAPVYARMGFTTPASYAKFEKRN